MDPVSTFVKYASQVRVKGHTRVVDGKLVYVDPHGRDVKTKPKDVVTPKTRSEKDLELWRKWKASGKDSDLQELMVAFEPMVRSKSNTYKGKVRIPDHAIDLMYKKTLVDAFNSYDPSKGASLSTYVFTHLNKVQRWIGSNQNVGRIPENRLYKIRLFKDGELSLSESLGRAPSTAELAKHLGWSESEVDRMSSELRSDLVSQNFEIDPYSFTPSRTEATLRLFKHELSGKERILYEHLTGYGRKKITEPKQLAKELGVPGYTVSRMKASIAKKLERYLDE